MGILDISVYEHTPSAILAYHLYTCLLPFIVVAVGYLEHYFLSYCPFGDLKLKLEAVDHDVSLHGTNCIAGKIQFSRFLRMIA